ncbi:uncharacterized protein LOC141801139 [Halichoeres trimaculatus]|uniref:uncharacterized protein LOC141801139 n=1 Tax=Halichoeres trimaculatus TaxID=147232 RepID=UPI003D9DF09A
MTLSRVGKRAPTLSTGSIMASTRGYCSILHLLLLGILLPSVLVSGQSTTPSTASAGASASSTMTAGTKTTGSATTLQTAPTSQSSTSGGGMASTTQSNMITSTSIASASTSIKATTMSMTSMASASTPLKATTMPTSSGGSASTTPSVGSVTMAQSSTAKGPGTTNPSSPMTSGSASSNTGMSTSQPSNSTGMSGMNTTNMYTSSMGMINCPSFACNYSDCYSMYMSQNTTTCTPGACCELIRQTDMYYTVGCSASCSASCFNASQTNCSVNCCNSTGCLNGSFASMMMTTTAMPTTKRATTTPMATTTTARPQTTANTGNKCTQGTCTGIDCYKKFATTQVCSSSQTHCQLKKETAGSSFKWTAGCTTDCSTETRCKETTKPPCLQECCNATTTSCLSLDGTPNFTVASRGPHMNTELIAYFLCLLALALSH